MNLDSKINMMSSFPDFNESGFDIDLYNQRFKDSNVIISARSKNVSYPEHWGGLSLKTATNGNEYYISEGCHYAVNDSNFLIFNEGRTYSSYIYSECEVDSFTLNFSPKFQAEIISSLTRSDNNLLDEPLDLTKTTEFIEKLYPLDELVSPVIDRIKSLSSNFEKNRLHIEELYYLLLSRIVKLQAHIQLEINRLQASKPSTRTELYRRLHRAKDFMDSCYAEEIDLDKLASLTCLNTAYLLRQFKSFFGVTPRQYLIMKRMEEAKISLENSSKSITEICYESGYSDLSSFGKLFKQFYQQSPEQYRAVYRKKVNFYPLV